ncbi:MAG: hypothetical protein ABI673_05160 [Novosphingobium sp.]
MKTLLHPYKHRHPELVSGPISRSAQFVDWKQNGCIVLAIHELRWMPDGS